MAEVKFLEPQHIQELENDACSLQFTEPVPEGSGTPVDPPPREKKNYVIYKDESELNLPEEDERETWTGKLDFLLSCIGFAVGLGNIWRFPYLCYTSGGGAFFIPYFSFLILCGLPLFFLETAYGQFASLSPITVWRISPLFKGIGYGMVIVSGLVCIYYNVIIAWNFFYLFNSFYPVLPWSHCDNWWNTEHCIKEMSRSSGAAEGVNHTSSQEFWDRNVLQITEGIDQMGSIRLELLGCLGLAWVIVFICLFKGVKSSGKVVYVTSTFPYFVLTALIVRGTTLPGAIIGIEFYVIPKWSKLLEFKVWGDAAVQIFFSVGMAWGSLITMSSYNKFSHNVFRDAMIVPLINCGTSVFAGFAIFSVLGFMAHSTGIAIDKVAKQGPGLIFVVYPEAIGKMPLAQFGMFETMTSAFIDEYPHLLRKKKMTFTACMCLFEFVLGIPMVFQGGVYVLQIVDWYTSAFSLMILSLTECMVITWIYGNDRFAKDIELMIGHRPSKFWGFMWKFVTPITILFIYSFSVSQLEPVSYGTYVYPAWAIVIGWSFGVCSLIPLPLVACYSVWKEPTGTVWQKIKKLSQPAKNWGPALKKDKERYLSSMNQFERDRYDAAQLDLDVGRYLKMRGSEV
ncbi:sodium- and chloride-dependent glycine transporter 1-like isoform X2 [Physella acuta]|uniref:sodium- and chloride-dependent glycine transporter 1-like isoform X2 n=1 Tax=Physella acuta TaxID=109671 RepID=UPI0027DDC9DE|nr:sodium- and chloride-dependent glycine transporter 1-like isoform X2 [Physella acuta]